MLCFEIVSKDIWPIGFLTLPTVKTKILFQELCLIKVDWDNELHKNLLEIQFYSNRIH